jgi:hypothetical protein
VLNDIINALRALPPGAALLLTREAVESELRAGAGVQALGETTDMTVSEAAARLGRAASTVGGWCAAGLLPGAFRLRGREWRVPLAGLRQFMSDERERQEPGRTRQPGGDISRANLGAWRNEGGPPR